MRMRAARKSRRRSGSEGPVSLFPFLAVLICTMGSLILLLVVIARQARLHAAEENQPDVQELRVKIDGELEIARLLASQFDASREATNGDLDKARYRLGQIEDHAGELRRQLTALQAAWKQLDQLESGGESAQQSAETELAAVETRIEQLEEEVQKAKQEADGRTAAYSIVPYEGPHGTKRRPIYIECRADGLVLQPEGVYFGADDFEGPLDAGNPLDVALRAVREYLAAQRNLAGAEDEEPYPLLLVRPSGIAYFYAGRAAMKSWGTEFGYELIGEDWKLDFPKPDPVLARSVAEAVEPARRRQQMLIAAAPSRYGGGGGDRPVYTVRPYRGGVVSRGGGGEGDGQSPLNLRASDSQGRFGNRYGTGTQGTAPGGPHGDRQQVAGQGRDFASSQAGSDSEGDGGPTGSSSDDCYIPGGQASTPSLGRNSKAKQSIAKTRGRNWGLPDASRNEVAITRPIRVQCHSDRLVIVPESGLGEPKTISLTGGTRESMDGFVSAVWDYMEGWGRAGRGMYWRPILNVYVGPGAEYRMAELDALLQDSGLIVNRAGSLTNSD